MVVGLLQEVVRAAETLKTLLLSKLQGKDKQLLDEIEAWAGRVGGAEEYMMR